MIVGLRRRRSIFLHLDDFGLESQKPVLWGGGGRVSKRRAQPGFAKLTSKLGANGANFIPLQSSMMGWEVQLR